MKSPSRRALIVGGALVALAIVFFLRPVFHGLAMSLWTSPLVWVPPLLILLVGLALTARRISGDGGRSRPKAVEAPAGRATDPRLDPVPRRRSLKPNISVPRFELANVKVGAGLIAVVGLAFFAFLAGSIAVGPLTAAALYDDTNYEPISGLPEGGMVRIIPKDVAEQSASSGFNSPTERLSDFGIVRTENGLEWTALRTPNSTVRTFSKKSQGIATLDAGSSSRQLELVDAEFDTAPGLQITDNLRWRLLKERFFVDLAEPVAIRAQDGEPRILVPYISYRGLIIRRPQLGGVFLVHPDGTIEDLSPEEAQQRPEVAGSGRLFPPSLAREIQDAYAYKNGIWNKLFLHEEQTQITDTEINPQPYLVDFGEQGVKWVTVAEPYGRAFAVNAIFLTDTATGQTQIWSVPDDQSLSGNRRAIQTVRSLTIPGVVFSDATSVGPGGGGRFRVVEPRPVFVNDKLVYLVSIIPEQANSVSKTVVIDAAANRQVAIFDNDSDPNVDQKITRYLRTGALEAEDIADAELAAAGGADDGDAAEAQADAQEPQEADAGGGGAGGNGSANGARSEAEVRRQLDELIERQRQALEDAEALREALGEPQ